MGTFYLLQNSADLFDVVGIVACHMGSQLPDRDLATFVNSEALPLLQRQLFQKLQVDLAK